MMTGLNIIHVPYRGAAAALTDLVGGQVQVMFGGIRSTLEFIRASKLRALRFTAATRSEVLPDLPTVSEFVPNYESSAWYGIGAPKNRRPRSWRGSTGNSALQSPSPKMRGRLVALGGTPLEGTPSDFARLAFAVEIKKWAEVVRFSGAGWVATAQQTVACPLDDFLPGAGP